VKAGATPLSEAFLEQSSACHLIFDRDGVVEQIYGDPSPLFKRSRADLLHGRITDKLDREQSRSWTDRLRRVLKGELLRLRERHGDALWYITVFPIRTGGEIVYAGAMAREVSPWNTAEQELRNTVLGALRAMEFEKKSMSRFLHDSVGQNLTAFGLQLDLVKMDLDTEAPEVCRRIGELQQVLEVMMEQVRGYSYELNPSTVERAGLRPALDRLAVRIRERYQGTLRINVDPSLKLDPKIAPALYQIVQEAVENSVQHSACTMIEVTAKAARAGNYVEIRDNGRGFDPADLHGGYRGLGLLTMEHYAAQAGLELTVGSNPGKGTVVRAVAPAHP